MRNERLNHGVRSAGPLAALLLTAVLLSPGLASARSVLTSNVGQRRAAGQPAAVVSVTVHCNTPTGQPTIEPNPVRVRPGDQVVWIFSMSCERFKQIRVVVPGLGYNSGLINAGEQSPPTPAIPNPPPATYPYTVTLIPAGNLLDETTLDGTIEVETTSCSVTCPPGAILENEPACYDGYYDNTNGGCNSLGWTELTPQSGNVSVACGQSGTFYYGYYSYRDTDWYKAFSDGGAATMSVNAEFDPLVILIYGAGGPISCSNYTYVYSLGASCDAVQSTVTAPNVGGAGAEFWPWVGPQVFGYGVPCGSNYVLTVTGCWSPATATEERSWGNVKQLFR